jgi:hypothetical protein|tara:strand:+ start:9878 stop:10513 length:636 start_codon:yes stop_codon:yes gene_type:complete
MAVSIPKTWSSGEVLTAANMQSNIAAVKKSVAITDANYWSTGQWCDKRSIVRPFIESTQNASHHVSGWYCSQNSGALFTSGAFISEYESSDTNRMVIPKTSITIPIARPATILFQFWASVESKTNEDGTRGVCYLFAYAEDNPATGADSTRTYWSEQISTGAINSGRNTVSMYNTYSGGAAADLVMGIAGYGDNASAQLLSWGFTVECFYI